MPRLLAITMVWLRGKYPSQWPTEEEVRRQWACPRCHSVPGTPCHRSVERGGGVMVKLHPLRWFVALDQNAYVQAVQDEESK